MKTIEELCGQVSATHEVRGDARVQVRGITADSRDVQPGDLFVCVAGAHVDGKTFAAQAAAKGAVAVLTTEPLPLPDGTVQIIVPDIHAAVEEMVPFFMTIPVKKCA